MNLFARFWNWIKRMFMVNHLSGFGGGGSSLISLTQKGYGYIEGASSSADLAMSYANVSSGSAPSAGDLVVWIVYALDNAAQAINTVSGWTQSSRYVSTLLCSSVLAKVVVAGDVSSPATVVSAPTSYSAAMWVAYSVVGSVSQLAVNGHDSEYSSASAAADDTQDSTALGSSQYAITISFGGGNDDTIGLTWAGATPDIQFQRSNFGGTTDIEYAAKLSAGGVSVTISKADDGALNSLVSAYVSVT